MPMASKNGATWPPTISMGTKAAMLVSTPKVAGMATLLAPRMTLSMVCPWAVILV